jgi:hypothetical protein
LSVWLPLTTNQSPDIAITLRSPKSLIFYLILARSKCESKASIMMTTEGKQNERFQELQLGRAIPTDLVVQKQGGTGVVLKAFQFLYN